MPQKKNTDSNDSYKKFSENLKTGKIGNFYIFHGDERYLLERSLYELRALLCPDGLNSFNYRRFEGAVPVDELSDAIDAMPLFAERTLVEVWDADIFNKQGKRDDAGDDEPKDGIKKNSVKNDGGAEYGETRKYGDTADGNAAGGKTSIGKERVEQLANLFSDLPDYVCLVVVFDTTPYKPGRQKADKLILKHAQVIEFNLQESGMLVKWITRHFASSGKRIGAADASYLIHVTGGYMSSMKGEIEKTAAYAKGETVTRSDIDAVVTPVLDAVVYRLTDALAQRRSGDAMRVLDELLRMREPAQKILFSISLKMRQLLAARVCLESNLGAKELGGICGIIYDFQSKMLLDTARKTPINKVREAVLLCADAAKAINSEPDAESRITELVTRLSYALL